MQKCTKELAWLVHKNMIKVKLSQVKYIYVNNNKI